MHTPSSKPFPQHHASSVRRRSTRVLVAVAAVALGVAAPARASVPHVFTNGDVADATEVNANFSALDGRVTALEGGAFATPKDLSGLMLWLDASDPVTVTLSGGKFTKLRDLSGFRRHAEQTDATRMPAPATLNGRTAMDFSSVAPADVMPLQEPLLMPADFTVVAVVSTRRTAGTSAFFLTRAVGGSTEKLGHDTLLRLTARVSTDIAGSLRTFTTGATHVVSISRTSANAVMGRLDGTGGQLNMPSPLVDPGTSVFDLLGSTSGGQEWDGLVGELLVYNRQLSSSEQASVEGYLAAKWGLALP